VRWEAWYSSSSSSCFTPTLEPCDSRRIQRAEAGTVIFVSDRRLDDGCSQHRIPVGTMLVRDGGSSYPLTTGRLRRTPTRRRRPVWPAKVGEAMPSPSRDNLPAVKFDTPYAPPGLEAWARRVRVAEQRRRRKLGRIYQGPVWSSWKAFQGFFKINKNHGVSRDDPEVFSIVAFEEDSKWIKTQHEKRLALIDALPDPEDQSTKRIEEWFRKSVREEDCDARHFPGVIHPGRKNPYQPESFLDLKQRINTIPKLWRYLDFQTYILDAVYSDEDMRESKSSAQLVDDVYRLLSALQVDADRYKGDNTWHSAGAWLVEQSRRLRSLDAQMYRERKRSGTIEGSTAPKETATEFSTDTLADAPNAPIPEVLAESTTPTPPETPPWLVASKVPRTDYDELIFVLRKRRAGVQAKLLEYMKTLEEASYQDISKNVHCDIYTAKNAIRANVLRVNQELELKEIPIRFRCALNSVFKEVKPR
jgi:hypothetical protein